MIFVITAINFLFLLFDQDVLHPLTFPTFVLSVSQYPSVLFTQNTGGNTKSLSLHSSGRVFCVSNNQ